MQDLRCVPASSARAAPALGKCSIVLLLSGAGPWWVLRFVSLAFLKARLLAEPAALLIAKMII